MNESQKLLKEFGEMLIKTVANSNEAPMVHGLNGLFSEPGLEREIITAHVRPYGIGSVLPLVPTVYEQPFFGSITGVTDVVGDQPDEPCEDAPIAYLKGCMLTAQFGRLRFDTPTLDAGEIIKKANRGDHTDLMLAGRLLGLSNLEPRGLSESQILQVLTEKEMVVAGISAERYIAKYIWQGTVAGGQWPGLDVQIATGQVDAKTNVTCPALDSDVKDFNYSLVSGVDKDIVEYMSMMEFYLRNNAETMGLDPVTWVIAMRPELWHELSEIWPIRYMTQHGTTFATGTNAVISVGTEVVRMRDEMRRSKTITINGNDYRVVTDTGIYERNNINDANLPAGRYASSIYFVPLTIVGSMPVCYREYLDYSQINAESALLRGMEVFWTDGGEYSWAVSTNKWCYELHLRSEQRIILRTPQLAGKIQKVAYQPLQHIRTPDPADPYWADGGVSIRSGGGSFHAVWGSR